MWNRLYIKVLIFNIHTYTHTHISNNLRFMWKEIYFWIHWNFILFKIVLVSMDSFTFISILSQKETILPPPLDRLVLTSASRTRQRVSLPGRERGPEGRGSQISFLIGCPNLCCRRTQLPKNGGRTLIYVLDLVRNRSTWVLNFLEVWYFRLNWAVQEHLLHYQNFLVYLVNVSVTLLETNSHSVEWRPVPTNPHLTLQRLPVCFIFPRIKVTWPPGKVTLGTGPATRKSSVVVQIV